MRAQQLTWAALLGRWTEFAKSAVALPNDAEGRRLRDSVADMITLQAVWFALQHLDELDASQKALGVDRADILIETHRARLESRFRQCQMPPMLHELIREAQHQLDIAKAGSV